MPTTAQPSPRSGVERRVHRGIPARPVVRIVGRALHGPWNEGTRVIARDLARAASRVADVSVVSVTNPAYASDEGIPGVCVTHVRTSQPYGVRSDYAPLLRVLRCVRPRRAPRGWIAHLIGAPLVVAPWARMRGARVIAHVTLVSQAYEGRIQGFRSRYAWHIFDRWVDAYACSSETIRSELVRRGQDAAKVHVLPPPIDTDTYRPIDRAQAREALGWDADEVVVAYIGTVSPLRFPTRTVLDALEAAATDIPRLRLSVFAPLAIHPYNVEWATTNVDRRSGGPIPVGVSVGDLDEAAKARVYSAADAVILPFAAPVAVEPPLTLLEAMACEAVPFVTPFANRSGIVRDGDNGYEWTTSTQLAQQLVAHLGADGAGRRACGGRARQTVVDGFGMDVAAERLQHLWNVVGAGVAPGAGQAAGAAAATTRRPRGATVAIIGPDGAGKSSVVAELARHAELRPLVVYMGVDRRAATHSLPSTRLLVRMQARRAATAATQGSGPAANEHRPSTGAVALARRALRNAIGLPHELAEFGYRVAIGALARRRGRLVLFDRYVYDSLIDCRVDGGSRWDRFRAEVLARLGRPDLVIVLDAPGDVLFARKGEHDVARLDRIRRQAPIVAARGRRVAVIDATEPLETVAAKALAEIQRVREA